MNGYRRAFAITTITTKNEKKHKEYEKLQPVLKKNLHWTDEIASKIKGEKELWIKLLNSNSNSSELFSQVLILSDISINLIPIRRSKRIIERRERERESKIDRTIKQAKKDVEGFKAVLENLNKRKKVT